MTTENTPRVTQADREAAAALLGFKDWEDAMDYRNSGRIVDGANRTARAFARHREAAEAAAKAREAELIEALSIMHTAFAGYAVTPAKSEAISITRATLAHHKAGTEGGV